MLSGNSCLVAPWLPVWKGIWIAIDHHRSHSTLPTTGYIMSMTWMHRWYATAKACLCCEGLRHSGKYCIYCLQKMDPQCQQQMGHAYHGWHYIVYREAKGCRPSTQDASKCTNSAALVLSVLMGGKSRKRNPGPMRIKGRSGLVVSQPKVSGRVVPGFHIDIDQCEQNFNEFVNSQIYTNLDSKINGCPKPIQDIQAHGSPPTVAHQLRTYLNPALCSQATHLRSNQLCRSHPALPGESKSVSDHIVITQHTNNT